MSLAMTRDNSRAVVGLSDCSLRIYDIKAMCSSRYEPPELERKKPQLNFDRYMKTLCEHMSENQTTKFGSTLR